MVSVDPRTGETVKRIRKPKSLVSLDEYRETKDGSTISSGTLGTPAASGAGSGTGTGTGTKSLMTAEKLDEIDKNRKYVERFYELIGEINELRQKCSYSLPVIVQPICKESFDAMYSRLDKKDIVHAILDRKTKTDLELLIKLYCPKGCFRPFDWQSKTKMTYFDGESWLEDISGTDMLDIMIGQLRILYAGINTRDTFTPEQILNNQEYIQHIIKKNKTYKKELYKLLKEYMRYS